LHACVEVKEETTTLLKYNAKFRHYVRLFVSGSLEFTGISTRIKYIYIYIGKFRYRSVKSTPSISTTIDDDDDDDCCGDDGDDYVNDYYDDKLKRN
jgi:hypothetical protein